MVRDLAIVGQLDWRKGIRDQDSATLGAVYAVVSTCPHHVWQVLTGTGYQAREEHPRLVRYENDWATAQIIIQFFMNRRRHAIKRERATYEKDAQGRRVFKLRKVLGKVKALQSKDPAQVLRKERVGKKPRGKSSHVHAESVNDEEDMSMVAGGDDDGSALEDEDEDVNNASGKQRKCSRHTPSDSSSEEGSPTNNGDDDEDGEQSEEESSEESTEEEGRGDSDA